MAATTIGNFPIGFRRGFTDWQRDLARLIAFAKTEDVAFLDFGPALVEELRQVLDAGVAIGSVDLRSWQGLVSPDAGRRAAAVAENRAHMTDVARLGVRSFLAVVSPEDPARARSENFAAAVDSYRELAGIAESVGARIVIEGAPGRPPWFANLACTPADLRAFLNAVGSPSVGVNYDPSHLIRAGIDPVRFIREFGERIYHAHAKDTVWHPDELYEHGTTQTPTFAPQRRYAGPAWRYVIPGSGTADWAAILRTLDSAGYRGGISLELEDEQYLGSFEAETRGLFLGRIALTSPH